MPIYEYQCDACGHDMEAIQKMSDDPLKSCPHCGKQTLRRKISAAGFRLKGAGWYETDFKQSNRRNVAAGAEGKDDKSGKDSKSGKDGGSSSKSDAAGGAKAAGGDSKAASG